MLKRLFKWVCSGDRCNGSIVARHRPRACPACGSTHSLRLWRKPKQKVKYLQCRQCGRSHAVTHRLKRCWSCGHTKFKAIGHDEHYKLLSAAWNKAVEEQRRLRDARE